MAFVVTYQFPVAGIVAPTALQAKETVTAVVEGLDADTDLDLTHNLGISAAELALGFPEVILEPLYAAAGTEARLADWVVTAKAANTIHLNKTAAVGSGTGAGPTVRVHIRRPHSIGR